MSKSIAVTEESWLKELIYIIAKPFLFLAAVVDLIRGNDFGDE